MPDVDITPRPIERMHRLWQDDGRRCITCRWVDVKPCRPDGTLGLGCTRPRTCYGQAKRDGACCSWEREPGADDEFEHGNPATSAS